MFANHPTVHSGGLSRRMVCGCWLLAVGCDNLTADRWTRDTRHMTIEKQHIIIFSLYFLDFVWVSATFHTGQEIQCLQLAGFFFFKWSGKQLIYHRELIFKVFLLNMLQPNNDKSTSRYKQVPKWHQPWPIQTVKDFQDKIFPWLWLLKSPDIIYPSTNTKRQVPRYNLMRHLYLIFFVKEFLMI